MAGTAAMKRIGHPKVHYETAKGNLEANKQYCSKEGKFEELGTPGAQGKRTDLIELGERIKSGTPVRDILWDEPMAYHQYGRTMQALEAEYERRLPGRDRPMEVWVFHGPAGSGKSTMARSALPGAFSKGDGTGQWWDGYVGQDSIIVGEMDFDLGINFWKQLMDEPVFSVQVKNGMKRVRATEMIICCNEDPSTWWFGVNEVHKTAFWRRVQTIVKFPLQ